MVEPAKPYPAVLFSLALPSSRFLSSPMYKRYWPVLVIVVVILDTIHTFWQNYHFPLDGDLVPVIFPAEFYSKVLHDPFGWAVLTRNETYASTNRFFAHIATFLYWRQMPHLLQYFTTPIKSLYVASALFSTLCQLLILFALAAYARIGAGIRDHKTYWLAALVLMPLFQTNGFLEQMGITSWAITYTFAYAFPTGLLLLLLWPFYAAACRQEPLHLHPVRAVLLVLLMVVIAFNGPIPIASVAVLLLCIGIYWAWQQWQRLRRDPAQVTTPARSWLSGQAIGLLGILAVLCIYSLYIGRNNAESAQTHTLHDLYKLLLAGFKLELTMDWGLPLLILLIIINAQLTRFLVPYSTDRQRVLHLLRWVGVFALIFILLLPFGGYRPYRPYLIRTDSIQPVLIGLLLAYGVSTTFVLHHLRGRIRGAYVSVLAVFLFVFIYADSGTKISTNNDCEQWTLEQIAQAKEPVVQVSPYCNVLAWGQITDAQYSKLNSEMLQYWGITSSPKLYYQR